MPYPILYPQFQNQSFYCPSKYLLNKLHKFSYQQIEEGKIISREKRAKLGHNQFQETPHEEAPHAEGHGMDPASYDKHVSMAEAIADCKVLLCGGMGTGAYESMRRLNIQPIITDVRDIETAAQAFIKGTLVDHTEFLH